MTSNTCHYIGHSSRFRSYWSLTRPRRSATVNDVVPNTSDGFKASRLKRVPAKLAARPVRVANQRSPATSFCEVTS